jgi:hypothetical protein
VDGAPRWKGTTGEDVVDPPVGCTMTLPAVIVVPLTVPSTRTLSPCLTAPAELELVPFPYVVDDASLTVTVCPVDVESTKPELDTLATVPTAPPAAGPDRALDPRAPGTGRSDVAAAEAAVVAVFEPLSAVALTMP